MRITARDEEIFRFLLEQKFGTLEAIYFRFFDRRANSSNPLPPQLFVTRQRLGRLCKAGLLTTKRVYTESKSLYLLTYKGYQVFKQISREIPYAVPVKSMDFRSYVHDVRVTYCRVALERSRRAVRWIAEREIRMKGAVIRGIEIPARVVPDGLFASSKGQWVAFELESSDRKASRFEQKASEYRNWISGGIIDRVLWVACDSAIHKSLTRAAGAHPQFTVATYAEFSRQLFPEGT